jgi:RNA polymerase sigma-70 factor (ECF subfamily)
MDGGTSTGPRVERAVIEAARRGDRDAFARIVAVMTDPLFATAFRILRDVGLAEDAVQEAMVAAWRELPHLRDEDRFEAWLRRILVHACYAQARRRRRMSADVQLLPIDRQTSVDEAGAIAQRDALERAFRHLPVEQRAVFVLHHHLGVPLVEIASTLGIPEGTARSRLHYAVRALRDQLREPSGEEATA